jgi:ADP-ribose pyrophosphatase YjhB (NUDIX family)
VLENDAGEILLCVRAVEPDKGKLDLPGGFLNFAEHPFDGAHRECREELGVDIEIKGVLGFCVDYYGTDEVATLIIAMLGRITSGTPVPADDVADIRWLKPESVKISDLAFTNNETIIFDLYARRAK